MIEVNEYIEANYSKLEGQTRDLVIDAFAAGQQSQQAKIDEINEVANGWKDEYRIMSLRYERSKKRIDELQIKVAFQEKAIKNIKLQFENKQIDCDRSDRKIDELEKKLDCCREENKALLERLAVYDKHVKAIKHIHETQFDKNTDTSFILGNLDGFIEYLESDLKGNKDEN